MKTFQPTPQRYLCALIACHPEPLNREPHVQELARRLNYEPAVVRREVESIAKTGQAVSICGKLREGGEAKVDAPVQLSQSTEPEGWWNLPQGEGEDWLDYVYRTRYRLGFAQDMVEWNQFFEWWGRSAQLSEEREIGLFDAEQLAYREIRETLSADPLWSQFELLKEGRIEELEDGEYQANDREVAFLFEVLVEAMTQHGVDWYDELEERLGMGQDEEAALKSVLLLVERIHGPCWRRGAAND